MLTKVEESSSLARAKDTKAILNTDVTALNAYKQRRLRERKQTRIFEEWDNFTAEIAEIKLMLKDILIKLEKIENK